MSNETAKPSKGLFYVLLFVFALGLVIGCLLFFVLQAYTLILAVVALIGFISKILNLAVSKPKPDNKNEGQNDATS
jgi:F0F1-type ATP synthase assembly protein I